MSELRRDPTTDKWVIIAPQRGQRPRAGAVDPNQPIARAGRFDPACPFCPGNESQLPAILAEMPNDQTSCWRTRVVPNKFPAVSENGIPSNQDALFYESAAGCGRHEVVIESPTHDHDLTTMPLAQVRDVLATCRGRCETMMADPVIRSVIVFRNRGTRGGASLRHPHTQLVALDRIAPSIQARQAAMGNYYQKEKRCVVCDMIDHERSSGSRIVNENDAFLTVVPFAASVPCEMWLLPRRHHASFGDVREGEIEFLALALRDALTRLDAALDNPPYNYVIDTATKHESDPPHLHWILRIQPRVTVPGGFELGSGLAINPSLPEQDAAILRSFGMDKKPFGSPLTRR